MRLKLYRGVWHAVWLDHAGGGAGRTRRASLRTQDRGLAERRLDDLTRAPAPAEIVGAIVEAYLAAKADKASHARMGHAWAALAGDFAKLRPDQVTRERCRAYALRRRQAGRQDGTIHKELSVLRTALQWHDRRTPARFELPAAPPPRDRHLSRAEYQALLAAAGELAHLRLYLVLAIATAARPAALLQLTWDRVDLEHRRIYLGAGPVLRLRGQKGRATVPINDTALAALQAAQEAGVSDWVIEWGGGQVKSVKKAFARAAARAGLLRAGEPAVTPHTLRHTAAVWMAEAGIPMVQIAQYLGHRDSRITERVYARFSPGFLAEAARALA